MPPESLPLPPEEIDLLTKWIEQGAKWEDHWAYVKPEPVAVPEVASNWGTNGIDPFILAQLEQHELTPSAPADRATLLRRASLDLTGLPPTPDETQAFLKDESPDAYEKQVDRLLASPHYGERRAALWMDLARYADSKGYEKDGERIIWQYRDWLIRAFNDDKPFDQFTIEQLAGDLLPNPTDEQIVATAFHRNTMNNDEGGTDDEEFRVAAVIDRVSTTWDVWQATTMACVQCHSHPYDPIRHEEFYQFFSFFNNTADVDVPSESPNLKTFTEEDQAVLEDLKNWVITHTSSNDDKLTKAEKFVRLAKITEPKLHPASYDSITQGSLADNKYLLVDNGGFCRIPNVSFRGNEQLFVSYSAEHSGGRVEVHQDGVDGPLLGTWQVKQQDTEWDFKTVSVPLKEAAGSHDIFLVFKNPAQPGPVCMIEWVLFHEPLPGQNQPAYAQKEEKLFHLLNDPEGTIATPVMIDRPKEYQRQTHVFERGQLAGARRSRGARSAPRLECDARRGSRQPLRHGPMAGEPGQSIDRPGYREPILGQAVWGGYRGNGRRLRHPGVQAVSPCVARLAGAAVYLRARLERKKVAQADGDVERVSAKLTGDAGAVGERPRQPPTGSRPARTAYRRAGARSGVGRGRVAERQDVRPQRDAAPARGGLASGVQRHGVEHQRGRRQSPPGTLHVLASYQSVSFLDVVRRTQPRILRHAPH